MNNTVNTTLEEYRNSFAHNNATYSFTDCTVRNNNIFCFIASKKLTDEDKKI